MSNKQYILEFNGPFNTIWFDKVKNAGGTIYNPYPPYSYRCVCDEAAADQISTFSFVKRIFPFPLSWKLSFDFTHLEKSEKIKCWVLLFDHQPSFNDITARLKSFGTILSQNIISMSLPKFLLETTKDNLQSLAELDDVFRLSKYSELQDEDEVACQIVAGNLNNKDQPFGANNKPKSPAIKEQERYVTWLQKIGVSGKGITISVLEVTGYVDLKHRSFGGRASWIDLPKNKAPKEDKISDHATMVAGQAAGGILTDGDPTLEQDAQKYYFGLGIAPESTIVSHTTRGSSEYEYCRAAVKKGATIQNASWGGKTANLEGKYESSDHFMDWATRNADNSSSKGKSTPLCICTSAGNNGTKAALNRGLSYPARGKNVITVGNFANYRPEIKPNGIDNLLDSVNKRYPSSSLGNCGDGRIKPDVVVPGAWTASAWFPQANKEKGQDRIINDIYAYGSGTSAASPKVAGACALLSDWWLQKQSTSQGGGGSSSSNSTASLSNGVLPSPAMLKAILINTAVDTKWETDGTRANRQDNWTSPQWTGNIPNMEQGWGRVCLNNFFLPPKNVEMFFFDQTYALKTIKNKAEQLKFLFQVGNPKEPLKATLVWTDFAGTPGTGFLDASTDEATVVPSLVNTLGFRLDSPDGKRYFGNHFENGFSKEGGYQDNYAQNVSGHPVNNVQNIFIEKPIASKNYELCVAGIQLTNDGLNPNQGEHSKFGGLFQQDFALIIWNAKLSTIKAPASAEDLDLDYQGYCKPKVQED